MDERGFVKPPVIDETPKPGRAFFYIIPILLLITSVLQGALVLILTPTPYMQYLPWIVGGIGVVDVLFLILLLSHALAPYFLMRKNFYALVAKAREDGERYEFVLKGSGLGFWDHDLRNKQIYFSAEYMMMLGYAAREQVAPPEFWYEILHPEDAEGVKRTVESHLDRRTPEYSIEYRIKRANGEYMWVADTGRAFPDHTGAMVRFCGVTRDVGNIKRVQEVLESRTQELEDAKNKIEAEIQNVKKFQKAVDASTEAALITDKSGAIIYVNQAWVRLNGYTDTEVIGRKPHILKSARTNAEIFRALWEKVSAGQPYFTEELFNRRKDGSEYQAGLSVFPVREGDQIIFYVATCQDITQRKEVDRAKTEFVSLASHQLRTPLSAIRWYSEMLMTKYVGELNEKQREYLKEIYQGNLRMVELVNALLNVSRIDLGTFAIDPEPVNLVEICESVLSELTPQIMEKKQTVERFFETAPANYLADPKLVRIIFQNFLSNSVKYTQEGGHIKAEISTKDNMLNITVADNGYGIPKQQQDKIFEKLFRADNVRQKDTEGTGLGMYIVKAIVDSSDGKIWFESEENQGTTFHVLLPLAGMPKKSGARGLG